MIRYGQRGYQYCTCDGCGYAYNLEFQHTPGHRDHETAYCPKCRAVLWEGVCTNVWVEPVREDKQ